ncbi:MAG: hypothetical protein CMP10_15900 [Zetaproteobacteria bacterium]|nr:hypothetical protein [Pseudobdellovibrionaceae bacterium]
MKRKDVICIYRNSRKVACGVIRKIKGRNAIVQVKRKYLKRIKRGMRVEPVGRRKRSQRSFKYGAIFEPVNKVVRKAAKKVKLASAPIYAKPRVRAGYLVTPLAAVTFDNPAFLIPSTDPQTLWQIASQSRTALFGLSGEYQMPLSRYNGVAAGFKYMQYDPYGSISDVSNDNSEYAEQFITGSQITIYGDFHLARLKSKKYHVDFILGLGLELAMSKIAFVADQKDDDAGDPQVPLADAKSSKNALGLRFFSHFSFQLSRKLAIEISPTLIIPILNLGQSESAFVDDNKYSTAYGDLVAAEDDLLKALNHSREVVAFEILFAGVFLL